MKTTFYTRTLMIMIIMLISGLGFAQLIPTEVWQTEASVNLIDPYTVTYDVTVNAIGKEYTFKTGCATGAPDEATADFDSKLELYDAAGTTLITSNDDGCEEYRSKLVWTATQGSYKLKVSRVYGTGVAFRLAYKYNDPVGGGCKVPPEFDGYIDNIAPTWTTITTPITIAAENCYVYRILLHEAAGTAYTFKTGCASGLGGDEATASFDTFFELYDASGNFLNSNDDQCEEGRSKLVYTSTTVDQIVYLKIRGYNFQSGGTFRLAYIYGDGPTNCQTITQAIGDAGITVLTTPPAVGAGWNTAFNGTINPGACKFYKVTLDANKTVTFKTGCEDGAITDFDTFLELWDANENYVTANDDGCDDGASKIIYTVPALGGGDYYLKVRGYNAESSGTYTLAYSYDYETVLCKSITEVIATNGQDYDPTITGAWTTDGSVTINSGECKIYFLDNLVTTSSYTFKTGCGNDATATFDTYLALFDAAGNFIDSDDDGCELGRSKLIYTPAADGDYYLKVSAYNDASAGTYRLAYRSGSDINCKTPPASDATLTPSTPWATTGGTIAAGECYVYEVQNIKEGNVYTFKTGCGNSASATFDTFLELYGATGNFINSNDDQCEEGRSMITWTATYGTGTLSDANRAFLKVRGYSETGTGSYTMAYQYLGTKELLTSIGNQTAENTIKVYPNPADQLFTIDSKAPVSFNRIILSELTGRMLHTWTMDTPATTYQINSSEFSAGIYVLSIETSERWIRKKISIVR
ncbi:MAG: T9SS type A sorting domain-containing protein [Bacteroidales bacterium]|nr:T9SS type A sorting domain-containing protein [Bacteroidales bacterium]